MNVPSNPAPKIEPARRDLLSRIGGVAGNEVILSRNINVLNALVPHPLASSSSNLVVRPAPIIPPVHVQSYVQQGITRFLIIWNIPNFYSWKDVLHWLTFTASRCRNVELVQVYRTNEMGVQVFWLVFKTEHQAESFRGRVASRYAERDHEIRCDFITANEFSSIAGRPIDRWDAKSQSSNVVDLSAPLPNDPTGAISFPSLATRIGLPDAPVAGPSGKKQRGKRAGKNRNKAIEGTTDGGAL